MIDELPIRKYFEGIHHGLFEATVLQFARKEISKTSLDIAGVPA
jgi:hypothetical protein